MTRHVFLVFVVVSPHTNRQAAKQSWTCTAGASEPPAEQVFYRWIS
jgi:hypothetical protein